MCVLYAFGPVWGILNPLICQFTIIYQSISIKSLPSQDTGPFGGWHRCPFLTPIWHFLVPLACASEVHPTTGTHNFRALWWPMCNAVYVSWISRNARKLSKSTWRFWTSGEYLDGDFKYLKFTIPLNLDKKKVIVNTQKHCHFHISLVISTDISNRSTHISVFFPNKSFPFPTYYHICRSAELPPSVGPSDMVQNIQVICGKPGKRVGHTKKTKPGELAMTNWYELPTLVRFVMFFRF